MSALVRDPAADVRTVIVAETSHARDPFLVLQGPIWIPPLGSRVGEVGRVVDEYAADAIDALGDGWFLDEDRAWILEHAAKSLSEIEKATLRFVALRQAGSITGAAARLGLSHVALGQWFKRHQRSEGRP